jgi:hypothetical protein
MSWTDFVPHGPEKISDGISSIFPMRSQTARDRLVKSRVPIFTDDPSCSSLEGDQGWVLRSRVDIGEEVESCMSAWSIFMHEDLRSEASHKNLSRFSGCQKYGCVRHSDVFGLSNQFLSVYREAED